MFDVISVAGARRCGSPARLSANATVRPVYTLAMTPPQAATAQTFYLLNADAERVLRVTH
jgi:hypothetical protein